MSSVKKQVGHRDQNGGSILPLQLQYLSQPKNFDHCNNCAFKRCFSLYSLLMTRLLGHDLKDIKNPVFCTSNVMLSCLLRALAYQCLVFVNVVFTSSLLLHVLFAIVVTLYITSVRISIGS